eukprot:UN24902
MVNDLFHEFLLVKSSLFQERVSLKITILYNKWNHSHFPHFPQSILKTQFLNFILKLKKSFFTCKRR